MANIGVRSPYFIYETEAGAGAVSAKLTLTIDSTNVYYIVKDSGASFLADISDIVRDYIEVTYDGTLDLDSPGEVPVTTSVQFYNTAGATGSTVGSAHTQSHTAFDGYRYFSEGNNFSIPNSTNLLSEATIWAPDDTAGNFYSTDASGNLVLRTYTTSATSQNGVTIKRYGCSKYDAIKCVFVNKFGVPQQLYFFTKTIETTDSSRESYKSNIISSTGTVDTNKHQSRSYNVMGKTRYILNTGFVGEEYNEFIRELMLSEQVWIHFDSVVRPVTPLTSSVQFRNKLNDKMVQYTIEFEQANDLISNVR